MEVLLVRVVVFAEVCRLHSDIRIEFAFTGHFLITTTIWVLTGSYLTQIPDRIRHPRRVLNIIFVHY